MQRLCGTVRTISFVFGVLLICIATLDAAPSPRIDENDSVIFSNNIESYTSPVVICTNLFHYLQKSGLLQFSNIGRCLNLLKFIPPHFYSEIAEEGPQQQLEILEMLARLGQNMIRDDLENSKRGLGFGMDRGFSGQQAAKHLMGLHAATWAGGPGRRRRSETEEGKRGFDFGLGRGHSAEQATRHRLGYEMANLVGKREPSEADE